MAPDSSRLVYTLDRERSYHFITLVLLVLAAVLARLGLSLTPADMVAEFGSIAAGRVAQVVLCVAAAGPILAWLWFMRRFVRRLSWLSDENLVEVELCGYFGRGIRRFAPADVLDSTAHAGRTTFTDAPSVNAPYRRLRIRGLPGLILDGRGTTHDARALNAVLGGRSPDGKGRPAKPARRPKE